MISKEFIHQLEHVGLLSNGDFSERIDPTRKILNHFNIDVGESGVFAG